MYLKNLILQKVVNKQKIISLNAVIIHVYFQCARMTMDNISTSGGLRENDKRFSYDGATCQQVICPLRVFVNSVTVKFLDNTNSNNKIKTIKNFILLLQNIEVN